jgi:acetyl-CoA acetyltransferase
MAEAYIYDAVRTPRGKGKTNGSLHEHDVAAIGDASAGSDPRSQQPRHLEGR